MQGRVERLAFRLETGHAESTEVGEELRPDQLDAGQDRGGVSRGPAGGDGAVEVVDHLEQVSQERAAAMRRLLTNLTPHPRAGLFELLTCGLVFSGVFPDGGIQRRDPLLELFDIRRLPFGGVVPAVCRVIPGPPPPVDDPQLRWCVARGRLLAPADGRGVCRG